MKKIYKKLLLPLALILLISSFVNIGMFPMKEYAADNGPVSICYDGKVLEFSQPGSIVKRDGYYLAPAEELASLTGWDTELGTASIKFTNEVLSLNVEANIGVKKFIINGQERVTTGSPEIVNGVVMIPVEDFFHTMNCKVKWDNITGTFTVSSPVARVFDDKEIIIHKAGSAPVIDGVGNDSAWVGASDNAGFSTVFYNNKPKSDTSFKVSYDNDAIYFFINCEGAPVPLEGISLLIAPSETIGANTPYFNAVLVPEPENTTVAYDNGNRSGGLRIQYAGGVQENILDKGTGFTAKYTVNSSSWTAEVKIPYSKLVTSSGSAPVPANAAEWRFNLLRVRPFTEAASSWVPVRNSLYSDNMIVGDYSYSVLFFYTPTTNRTGSIFFEGYPETDIFGGTQMPYISIVPQNAGLRYMGYDTKLVTFDKEKDLNVKKSKFSAEWIDQLGIRHNAEILKITEKDSKLYFIVKHPNMSEDGLYGLNIYIDKDNGNGNGNGKAKGKIIGVGNMVKKYSMMFDRQQVMDAGVIFNSYLLNASSNKTILGNTNLKESEQSDTVKNLIKIIPETLGFSLNGAPVSGNINYDPSTNTLKITDKTSGAELLSVTGTKNADGTVTYTTSPAQYQDNGSYTLTSKTGKPVVINYYQDSSTNKKYFVDAMLNAYAEDYITAQLATLAKNDPLGAAYVLYELAKAYQDWMPKYDYYNNASHIEWDWGPPFGHFGALLNRWNFEELDNVQSYSHAYAAIKGTNAMDIVSSQVGQDAEELLLTGMFYNEVQFFNMFPNQNQNMNYKSWQGLVSLGRDTGEPDYVHQAISMVDEYAKGSLLLDGFWKEVTLSYHVQSINGIVDTIDKYLKGWSDPQGYISPRTGRNVQNLDMTSWYPVLKASNNIRNIVAYPTGRAYPIQDTWESLTTTSNLNLGSVLLPAANIARMSKGTGTNTNQLYMTYTPRYGSHCHNDPLSLGLWSNGLELLPDLGYTHSQIKPYAVSTLAHNTVVVDSKDSIQSDTENYGGKVENYADIDSTVQIMKVGEENAYPGITNEYDREPWYIKMEGSDDSYILDIFRVNGGSTHEYTLNGCGTYGYSAAFTTQIPMTDYNTDTVASNNDKGRLLPVGTKVTLPTSETDGGSAVYNGQELYYAYTSVDNVKKADLADGKYVITLATKSSSSANTAGMKITGFAGNNSQLFIGRAPSLSGLTQSTSVQTPKKYVPKMVVRRQGESGQDLQSTFVNVMEPYAGNSAPKISSIEKLTTSNSEDIAMKVSYTTASGNFTDILLSSSNPSIPMTVSDAGIGSITLTGKMAFIRYLKDSKGIYRKAKAYTVETESLDVNGENIAGEGRIEGNVINTMRIANGDSLDAFVVDTAVSEAAVGKTIAITHPDGSVNAYEVTSVKSDGQNTIIGVSGGDPGYEVLSNGSSQLLYYPLTKWSTNNHTFKISMDTVKDYGITRKKQRMTYYTLQDRQNAKDNIAKGYTWAVAAKNSAVALADTYAAKSNDELWNMVTPESLNADMQKALQALSEAYIYTDNMNYAKAGLILLDRIADIYPDKTFEYTTEECSLEQTLAKAYDAFYSAVNNPDLITFLSDKAAANNLENPKSTGDFVCLNIENRILKQIRVLSEKPEMADNYGMQQAALALAAVVYDTPSETNKWLNLVFGDILPSLVNNADRDGMGNQGSTAYNKLWADSIVQIAGALDGYDSYSGVNLYENPAFVKTLSAFFQLSAIGKYTVQTGDSLAAGTSGPIVSMESVIKSYEKTGNALFAQYAYYLNDNRFDGLHSDIFTANAESIKDAIAKVISDSGELKLGSTTMPGYGFGILRDGFSPYRELRSSASFNNMTKDSSNPNTITKYFTNGATQLEATAAGLSVAYLFQIPKDGIYRIDITPYMATSYGIYDILVDGVKQSSYDFYGSTGVNSGVLSIMTGSFAAGTHTIKFVCTGKRSNSTNYKMGIMNFISTQVITQDDTRRDVWMYYGKTDTQTSHKDQLELGVHEYGADMSPDLGTSGDADKSFLSGTISHNTVAVDNSDQHAAGAGTTLHFDDSGMVQVMEAESNNAYEQTDIYRRSVVMIKTSESDSYSVDFFRVKGGDDHTYSFHGIGTASYTGTAAAVYAQGTASAVYQTGTAASVYQVGTAASVYQVGTAAAVYGSSTFNQAFTNIRTDSNPSSNFSIDYNQANDTHLRLTMLGDYNNVSLADYTSGGTDMDYVLVNRNGTGLESVFTSVIEPFKGSRYIQSIEETVVFKDGVPVSDMEARAVKVTLADGRIDYIISTANNENTYNVAGKFNFKGYIGVYSEKNGAVVTSYVNDGTVIGGVTYDTGAVTGTVKGFTKELASQNQLSVTFSAPYDANKLVGKYIYVQNDGVQNGMYQIKGVVSQSGNDVSFDLGTTSVIRSYADSADPSKGFVYNIDEGSGFTIPLGNITTIQ